MKISDVLNRLAKQHEAGLVVIGKQEAIALRNELRHYYNHHVDLNDITAGDMHYRGLRIIVGHNSSCVILCKELYSETDPSVHHARI